mgnify:CR=1 FL=1
MRTIHTFLRPAAGALLALLLGGCAESATAPADYALVSLDGGAYFIRQPEKPGAVMEALFLGQVVKDEAGCLRLQSPADATVVWPYRSSLGARDDGLWVVDAAGKEIGRIGGAFRFGGGEVPFLHEGLGFHEPERSAIHARCPGRYWIVGEVLTP